MKQIFTNSLRAFMLAVSFLFVLSLSAVEVEIDGINYDIIAKAKQATVIEKSSGSYSGAVVIPESVEYEGVSYAVTSIGGSAFFDCSGLTSVTIPNSVTSIGWDAFSGCSGLTSVTIPNSVTSIGDCAFLYCSGLTSVTIPNSVTSIGEYTFYGCSGLTSVTIPNSVTSIGHYAFERCSGLTSVTIPNSVTSIGHYAFAECPDLTDVYCYAEEVPSTGASVFKDSYVEYATLHVPTGAMEKYIVADPWSGFGKIVALTEQETGIEELEAENANNNDAPVYNLNGMRMQNADNLPKGIYIKGGKKFVVK